VSVGECRQRLGRREGLENAIAILLRQQGLDRRPVLVGRRNEENGACFVHERKFNPKTALTPALIAASAQGRKECMRRLLRTITYKRNNMAVLLHCTSNAFGMRLLIQILIGIDLNVITTHTGFDLWIIAYFPSAPDGPIVCLATNWAKRQRSEHSYDLI
jgi:hypothetical protein